MSEIKEFDIDKLADDYFLELQKVCDSKIKILKENKVDGMDILSELIYGLTKTLACYIFKCTHCTKKKPENIEHRKAIIYAFRKTTFDMFDKIIQDCFKHEEAEKK